MEQLGSHRMGIHGILYLSIIRKSVEKIQVLLQYYKTNGLFTRTPKYIMIERR